ncbi:MAG: hypothetical protein IAE92_11250 [Burkholderiaceae bacterium]|nr:hypothetical protein [Burkholderiaceae bacterium]
MLHVHACVARPFELPVSLAVAVAHFRDFRQLLPDLPELTLSADLGPGHYRVRYRTTVRGVYKVELFTDIAAHFDEKTRTLSVTPLEGHDPVPGEVTMLSMSAHGQYTSRLALSGDARRTRGVYELDISADMPKPLGLKLMPDALAAKAIETVMQKRAEASTGDFIDRSARRLARASARKSGR